MLLPPSLEKSPVDYWIFMSAESLYHSQTQTWPPGALLEVNTLTNSGLRTYFRVILNELLGELDLC